MYLQKEGASGAEGDADASGTWEEEGRRGRRAAAASEAATWAPASLPFPVPVLWAKKLIPTLELEYTRSEVSPAESRRWRCRSPSAMLPPGLWAAVGSLLGGLLFVVGGKKPKGTSGGCARALQPRSDHWCRRRVWAAAAGHGAAGDPAAVPLSPQPHPPAVAHHGYPLPASAVYAPSQQVLPVALTRGASDTEELRLHLAPHALQTALRMALFWQQQREARLRWQGLAAASASLPAAGLTAAAAAGIFVAVTAAA